MVITESKLHDSYSTSQFFIDGFSAPFRLDRNVNGGRVLIYTREDITYKQLFDHSFPDEIEGLFVELNFRKCKWLLGGVYHPPIQRGDYFFNCLGSAINVYNTYDNILLVGDFNAEEKKTACEDFLDLYNRKDLVKDKTCYIKRPTCIDLLLTNCRYSFQHTKVILAGISDHHKMIMAVTKTPFLKTKPREITFGVTKSLLG